MSHVLIRNWIEVAADRGPFYILSLMKAMPDERCDHDNAPMLYTDHVFSARYCVIDISIHVTVVASTARHPKVS